jgi:hypothetical protein
MKNSPNIEERQETEKRNIKIKFNEKYIKILNNKNKTIQLN